MLLPTKQTLAAPVNDHNQEVRQQAQTKQGRQNGKGCREHKKDIHECPYGSRHALQHGRLTCEKLDHHVQRLHRNFRKEQS
eukprot:5843542-Amphidinium_carterae.1